MFASVFVLIVSVLLFAYWFRYTCLLILSTESARDYTRPVADANGLCFLQARETLSADVSALAFQELRRSLDRDFRLVTYLLRNAGTEDGQEMEHVILRIDYRLMRIWYGVSRLLSVSAARKALLEQATIIAHLANAMGERSERAAHA